MNPRCPNWAWERDSPGVADVNKNLSLFNKTKNEIFFVIETIRECAKKQKERQF